MYPKKITHTEDSRAAVERVTTLMEEVVGSTLGPGGQLVLIGKEFSAPEYTKDGATVARDIKLQDRTDNAVAHAVKEAAVAASRKSGDATTTTTVLIGALVRHGLRAVKSGSLSARVAAGMAAAADDAVAHIRSLGGDLKPDDLLSICKVATNGDVQMSELIAGAAQKVGADGVITVDRANRHTDEADTADGYVIDKGYEGSAFINDAVNATCEFKDALILVIGDDMQYVSNGKDMAHIIGLVRELGKPVVIICNGIQGDALTVIAHNHNNGVVEACMIVSPNFGDYRRILLDDICAFTGASLVGNARGKRLCDVVASDFGVVPRIVVGASRTVIFGSNEHQSIRTNVAKRIAEARGRLSKLEEGYDHEFNRKRIASLNGQGVCEVRIGGRDDLQAKERKARAEDAAMACASAYREGIIPGGATALVRASVVLEAKINGRERDFGSPDEGYLQGYRAVIQALRAPFQLLHRNAGWPSEAMIEKMVEVAADAKKVNFGYDATDGKLKDLRKANIIEPVFVVTTALLQASSTATQMVRTSAIISNIIERAPNAFKDHQYEPD